MNRREFAERFETIQRRLWLTAVGCIGDRTEADDIVQEAAVIAFRKLKEYQPGTNFLAWLTRIVRHCAANHNRKTIGRRTFATDPGSLDQVAQNPTLTDSGIAPGSIEPNRLDLGDEMLRALQQLSENARCCLLLRVVDGASYAEIAQSFDIPEGTAMSHVHRSKKLIRELLGSSSERGSR